SRCVRATRAEVAERLENPKSALQELVQTSGGTPVYRLVGHEGPPHDRTFTVEVIVADEVAGVGVGRSKKDAEAAAAAAALERLTERD
ncbi:MAG: ribonuclease III, partial [Actinobacteria bacterium]